MHGSDLSLRRYVAIEALRRWGCPLKSACIEVGERLGKGSQEAFDVIKSGYEKFRPPYAEAQLLRAWDEDFLWWKKWVRGEPQSTIDFFATRIPDKGQRDRFLALASGIRKAHIDGIAP